MGKEAERLGREFLGKGYHLRVEVGFLRIMLEDCLDEREWNVIDHGVKRVDRSTKSTVILERVN